MTVFVAMAPALDAPAAADVAYNSSKQPRGAEQSPHRTILQDNSWCI
jgi:hypothetical protein